MWTQHTSYSHLAFKQIDSVELESVFSTAFLLQDTGNKIIVSGVKYLELEAILLYFTSIDFGGDGCKPLYKKISDDEIELQFRDPRG